jgi:hypothetical protein
MNLPCGVERLDPESVEIGVPIGRSWILLFGLLPFDYDEVCLARLDARGTASSSARRC